MTSTERNGFRGDEAVLPSFLNVVQAHVSFASREEIESRGIESFGPELQLEFSHADQISFAGGGLMVAGCCFVNARTHTTFGGTLLHFMQSFAFGWG